MIHPDEALAAMAARLRTPELETVPLRQALGRMLPDAVVGRIDQPPFDKAAMDGWAWASAEPGGGTAPGRGGSVLRVAGTIPAGASETARLEPGCAARIMTGAPLPAGADRVQRFEWARERDGLVEFTQAETVANVIRRGENSRAGNAILSPRLLSASDLGILAADGRAEVQVSARIRVGVLSTGTELVEPGMPLGGAAIYDSNKTQILAQLSAPAFDTVDLGSLADDFDATLGAVRSALGSCEVLLLSGGVSMGDFDYVPKALAAAGVETIFHGVAMKPGKPTYFGSDGRAFVVGMPGNPVSVFVNIELLVKELLFALSGVPMRRLTVPVRAATTISRKPSDRVEFLPVRIDGEGAWPVAYGGSSSIQSLAEADGFIRLEIGQDRILEGQVSGVRLVR